MAILIDAEQLSKHKYVGVEYNGIEMGIPASAVNVLAYKWGWNDALDSVKRLAPTVDAVEVVRCKDCKWCEERQGRTGNVYNLCVYLNTWVDEDHFCSCGERREDD